MCLYAVCKWLEVVGSVSRSRLGDVKGKRKVVAMSPRAGEKKKHIKKSAGRLSTAMSRSLQGCPMCPGPCPAMHSWSAWTI